MPPLWSIRTRSKPAAQNPHCAQSVVLHVAEVAVNVFTVLPSTEHVHVTGVPAQSSVCFWMPLLPSQEQVTSPPSVLALPLQARVVGGLPGEPPPTLGGETLPPPLPLLPLLLGPPLATEKHSVEPSFTMRQQTSPSALETAKPSGHAQLWTVPPPP